VATVRLTNISKTYDNAHEAVRDISFEVKDGEFVVLVGPSGCGKTTTLRMIAGLEEISSGTLAFGDTVMNNVAPKDRDIAMVFQNYALYPHKTVFENLAFSLRLRKYPKPEIESRVREAAKILSIENILHEKPKTLSGGQRQRVAVGRAIVRRPKVFLFDEPLSNLDAQLRVQMRTELLRLHQRLSATMIYVTHDQTEAMTLGERIVVMKDGVVQQIAPPMEIYANPANTFVAEFIGIPPMNFLHGTIELHNGALAFCMADGVTYPLNAAESARLAPRAGGGVVAGVRPEYIAVARAGDGSPATIEFVELLGSDMVIYASLAGNVLRARCSSDAAVPRAGETIGVSIVPGRAHFFDPATKLRIQ